MTPLTWDTWVYALLHTLWQGPLVALVMGIVLSLLPARRAETRYAMCCVALVLVVVALGANLAVLEAVPEEPGRAVSSVPVRDHQENVTPKPGVVERNVESDPAKTVQAETPARFTSVPWQIVAGWLWLTGALFMLTRTAMAMYGVRALATEGKPLVEATLLRRLQALRSQWTIRRPVALCTHPKLGSPQTLGIWRPVILLPASAMGLPVEVLEAAIVHELAHIRRHDYAVNLLQRLIECLLFFNPAVWWINRQVRMEREACCDRMAANALGNAAEYTRALAEWGAHSATNHLALAPGIAARNRNALLDRARRLLLPDRKPSSLSLASMSIGFVLLGISVLGMLMGSGYWATTVVAQALSDAERIEQVEEAIEQFTLPEEDVEPWRRMPIKSLERASVTGTVYASDSGKLGKNLRVFYSRGYPRDLTTVRPTRERGSVVYQAQFKVPHVWPGDLHFCAWQPGYAPAFLGPIVARPGATLDNVVFFLDRGFTATAYLVDDAGAPLRGVPVKYRYKMPAAPLPRTLRTDESGKLQILNAARAPIELTVDANGVEHTTKLWQPEVGIPERWEIKRAVPLRLNITSASTGEALPDSVVYHVSSDQVGNTDPPYDEWIGLEGQLAVAGRADEDGTCLLTSLRDDTFYALLVEGPSGGRALLDNVHVSDGERDAAIPPEIHLAGTITGLEEVPRRRVMPNKIEVSILFVPRHAARSSSVARYGRIEHFDVVDGEAKFHLDGLWPGEFRLDTGSHVEWVTLEHSKEDLEIDAVESYARKTHDHNVRDVVITFNNVGDEPPRGTICVSGQTHEPIGSGRRNLVDLRDGKASCQIAVPESLVILPTGMIGYYFEPRTIRNSIPVPEGDSPFEIQIDVLPAGGISGSVTCSQGCDAGRIRMMVVRDHVERVPKDGIPRTFSELLGYVQADIDDADKSRAKFLALPLPLDQTYHVVATYDATLLISTPLRLTSDDPSQTVNMVLPAGEPLYGMVRDHLNHPVAGAAVSLRLDTDDPHIYLRSETTTDMRGRFRFEHVNFDVGSYEVRVQPRGRHFFLESVTVERADSPVALSVVEGLPLHGRVVHDLTGLPLAGVKVVDNSAFDEEQVTTTDEEGRFYFEYANPARHTLMLQIPRPRRGSFFDLNAEFEPYYMGYARANGGQSELVEIRAILHTPEHRDQILKEVEVQPQAREREEGDTD